MPTRDRGRLIGDIFTCSCLQNAKTIQSVPEKSDTIEILIVLKPLLKARDYTPGNLMKLYLQLSILKRSLTVNTISLNSRVCNHPFKSGLRTMR